MAIAVPQHPRQRPRDEHPTRRWSLVALVAGLQLAVLAIVVAMVAGVGASPGDPASAASGAAGGAGAIVASTTFPKGRYELRARDAGGEVCLTGGDLSSSWRHERRCLPGLPEGMELVVWPARDPREKTTVYYGITGADVRSVSFVDDRGRAMTVPTQTGDLYRGRYAGELSFIALRLPGDRRLRDFRPQ